MRSRLAPWLVVLAPWLVVLALGGCVTPAFDRGAYQQNAAAALDAAVSETRTAQLAAQSRVDGNATRPFADTVITGSEKALGPIEASFGGVDPPSRRDDPLRQEVLELLGEAQDSLASARIAVRRDDRVGLRQSVVQLGRTSERLERARTALG